MANNKKTRISKIKKLKAKLPKHGAYRLIVEKDKRKLTYDIVRNYMNGRNVSPDMEIRVLNATKKVLKEIEEQEAAIEGMF